MARARQLPARRSERTWTWEIAPSLDLDPVRVVTCIDEAALTTVRNELYSRQVPLVEAPPFRLVLARRPAGDILLLNANHAGFDGFGCVRLQQSVALHYTASPDPGPPVPLDTAREVERHLAAPDREARARRLRMLLGKGTDLARRPDRVGPDGGRVGPGYRPHVCAIKLPTNRFPVSDKGGRWRRPHGGGRLHLSFRFRTPVAGADAARRFADRFVADLLALAGEGG